MKTFKKYCEENNLDTNKVFNAIFGVSGSFFPSSRNFSSFIAEIKDDCIIINNAKLLFDKEKYSAKVTEASYKSHKGEPDILVYLIDFEFINNNEREFRVEIRL